MSTFYKLRIQNIIRETKDAIVITFAIPEELKTAYQFIAGQYVTLKLTLDGEEVRRAYSICTSPVSGVLSVSIKSVADGYFSKFANQNLKVGDFLEVSQPEGRFTFEPETNRQTNYLAFAAGSGITPILSIIYSVLEQEPQSSIILVYGNKTPENTMFLQTLHDLQNQYVGRLFVHYVYSQAKQDESLFGRIDKSIVNFVLNNKHSEKTFDTYYLCGPETMINTVSDVLKSHNVPEKNIKFELFTPVESEKEVLVSGHSKITVLVDDEETEFEMSQKQTVLEAALKHGLDVPYSCQGGICSSCLARVKEGNAMMVKNSILTDKEIADGLILTCQAHPTTDIIVVDYDDV